MPRPKTVSDEEVLDAANKLLFEKGDSRFTLTEIASRVGLSRAAVIQRFGNRDRILQLMAIREVDATREYLGGLPVVRDAAGLWSFLAEIVYGMGDGSDFSVRAHQAWVESCDPDLRVLANTRYQLVQDAIQHRLPDEASIDGEAMAKLLHSVIAGATMQWIVAREGTLPDYIMPQLQNVMMLIFPDERFD